MEKVIWVHTNNSREFNDAYNYLKQEFDTGFYSIDCEEMSVSEVTPQFKLEPKVIILKNAHAWGLDTVAAFIEFKFRAYAPVVLVGLETIEQMLELYQQTTQRGVAVSGEPFTEFKVRYARDKIALTRDWDKLVEGLEPCVDFNKVRV